MDEFLFWLHYTYLVHDLIRDSMRKGYFIILVLLLQSVNTFAQQDAKQKNPASIFAEDVVKPRMRVIIDNDFGGDPDGLFQLVHSVVPSGLST